MAQFIGNAVLGALFVTAGTTLFYKYHKYPLNLAELFWAVTVLKPPHLFKFFPIISGIFFASGIIFDWMQYDSVGIMTPYGPEPILLQRSSMYGFALGAFLLGFGGQLAGGDLIYFSCSRPAQGHWFSFLIILIMMASSFFVSWLLGSGYMPIFSNQEANPLMPNLHLISANITIALSIVLFIVSTYNIFGDCKDRTKTIKKVGASFMSGVLISLGFMICGLSIRTRLFVGMTPGQGWQIFLLLFIAFLMLFNSIIYHVSQKCQKQNTIVIQEQIPIENNSQLSQKSQVPEISMRNQCIGAIMMGVGWALTGLQIVVYLIHSAIFTIPSIIVYGAFLIFGSMLANLP